MSGNFRVWVELTANLIEALAVALMVGFIVVGTMRWLFFSGGKLERAYGPYRIALGKGLQVGLEVLVAADIIRTVALDFTLPNMTTLAALVAVRTFLGWTLALEVDGRWPWQQAKEADLGVAEGNGSILRQGAAKVASAAMAEQKRGVENV